MKTITSDKNLLVVSHFGLGDHIVINGLLRKKSSEYKNCVVLVRRIFLDTLTQFYSDLENVKIIGLHPSFEGPMSHSLIEYLKFENYEFLKLGYFGDNYLEENSMKFDEAFYFQANESFNLRWDNFNYTRNYKKENEVYNQNKCYNQEYIFLHEDKERKFLIDRDLLPKNVKIIEPNFNSKYSIFHYRKILEHAKEIHCIESSFTAFIESIQIASKLFAHRYSRPEAKNDPRYEYTYRLPWRIYR